MDNELLEKLSDLEHQQWCEWAGSLSSDLSSLLEICDKTDESLLSDEDKELILKFKNKLKNWDKLMIPYSDLSEDEKEKDRVYGRKILAVLDD